MEQIAWEAFSKCAKGKKVIGLVSMDLEQGSRAWLIL